MLWRIVLRIWAVIPSLPGARFFNDLMISSSSCGTTGSINIEHSSLSPIYSVGDVFTTGIPLESELLIFTKKSLKRSEIICLSDVMEPSESLIFSCILALFLLFMIPFRMDHVFLRFDLLLSSFSATCVFSAILANDSIYFCNVYNMIHCAPILFSYISYIK